MVFVVLTGSLLRADEFADTLKKAEQGSVNDQIHLGIMYLNGEGAPKSPEEALKWFQKAADGGTNRGQSFC